MEESCTGNGPDPPQIRHFLWEGPVHCADVVMQLELEVAN